jgi:Acetyltransferases, including N-acetylases of ribosomal proteins
MFSYKIDAETELRLLEEADAEELYAAIDRNRVRLYWLKPDYCFEDTKAFIKRDLHAFADNKGFRAGIWYKGRLAGSIRYNDIDWTNRKTELGYWIDEACEGKGLIAKACKVLIDYAFHQLKLNRVEIRCNLDNLKSRAIAERLGFKQEAVLREVYWHKDHFVDLVVYAMLASEWQSDEGES